MRVLFLAAEAAPYVKVGGLGDVAGALPAALRARGLDVRLALPRYGTIDPQHWQLTRLRDNFPVAMDWRVEQCQLWTTPDAATWLIENQYFFGSRSSVYGHDDDAQRFVLFCRAALEACRLLDWWPDVIHAHDWHSAAAIRLAWAATPRPGLVFTIHNLAHQGRFDSTTWPLLQVYDAEGDLNLMQQALLTTDVITTVSPTYAAEILRSEYGCGLDELLRQRSDRLVGVLNGLDMARFDPATDPQIPYNFDHRSWQAGRPICKAALQHELGLAERADVPLLGMVSRLDGQKGCDLLLGALPRLIEHTDAQLLVLGSGNPDYEEQLRAWAAAYPQRVACFIGFNAALAQRVYAGADIFLMPSAFEPCGLSQMIAMRYGAVPVARATGGLVDTVPDLSRPDGCGVLFTDYTVAAFEQGLHRALSAYRHPADWAYFVQRAMERDWSWDRAAKRYEDIYHWAWNVR